MSKELRLSHVPILKLVLSAMFVTIGIVLPFFTGQIQQIGNMLLPMHLPVFLCGLICGWQYGTAIGFVLPIMRSLMFGMPHLYPNAVSMAIELAFYGMVAGLIYSLFKKQNTLSVYAAMLPSMLLGRAAWGMTQIVLLGIDGNVFTWQMFMAGAFLNAIPGIVLQLVLIPAIISALHHTGIHRFKNAELGKESGDGGTV